MFIEVPKFHETSPALKNFWLRACISVLVLGTCSTPKQGLVMIFWQGDWDVCLGMVTDLQSFHSVHVVGS